MAQDTYDNSAGYSDPNWSDVETKLKQKGGQLYDPSDLEGVKRNYYNSGSGNGGNLDSALNSQYGTYDQRQASNNSPASSIAPPGSPYSPSSPSQPSGPDYSGLFNSIGNSIKTQNDLTSQLMQSQQAQQAADKERSDSLYNTLLQRSQQGLDVNPSDPIIAKQVDAYRAEQTRGARNSIDAMAEAYGPQANLTNQRRLMNENSAQSTGNFQATLLGNELSSKRNEIAQALTSMGSMLSADQQNALTKQLAVYDNMIKQQGLGLQNRGLDVQQQLGEGGLSNDLLRTMLQNQQYNSGLQSQNDQFNATLGLNSADRAAYWDAVRSGLIT